MLLSAMKYVYYIDTEVCVLYIYTCAPYSNWCVWCNVYTAPIFLLRSNTTIYNQLYSRVVV